MIEQILLFNKRLIAQFLYLKFWILLSTHQLHVWFYEKAYSKVVIVLFVGYSCLIYCISTRGLAFFILRCSQNSNTQDRTLNRTRDVLLIDYTIDLLFTDFRILVAWILHFNDLIESLQLLLYIPFWLSLGMSY